MSNGKLLSLTEAFQKDFYDIENYIYYQGRLGVAAKHQTATINEDQAKKKKAYYLEGSHREMGYLLGYLAEEDISRMTTGFVNNMIWELLFWHPRKSTDTPDPNEDNIVSRIKYIVGDLMGELMAEFSRVIAPDVPPEYLEELAGMEEGCRAVNPGTEVKLEDLWVLNFGIDWFFANVYSGLKRHRGLLEAIMELADNFTPPYMCNGFSLLKDAANGGHYFGRDFMFPTAGVFEDTACLIVYNPAAVGGVARIPFVSVTAPGMLGSVAGMNLNGVAIGLEIYPSAAADPQRPGFNSLPLNRYVVETGATAELAKNVIVNAQRGVPWLYIISDGTSDRACVVEAGYSTVNIPFLDFPPKALLKGCLFCKPLLPGEDFLRNHPTAPQENGVMVRWNDYSYDRAYLDFNKKLFKRFDKTLYPDWSEQRGYINRTCEESNCPRMYYFAPERETRSDVVITTNHAVIPEMRYTAMTDWLALLFGRLNQDSQWRYDALNDMILDSLAVAQQNGQTGVDYAKAKEILNFLSPLGGKYPDYYGSDKEVIEGAQSLFDLKLMTIESHYGYYVDDWVKLHLKEYVP